MQHSSSILSLLTPFSGRYGPITVAVPGHGADALRIAALGAEVKHLTAVRTLAGVVVAAVAARNGPGVGYLRSSGDGSVLSWLAPGSSTYGIEVECGSDGAYVLTDGEDPDKWIRLNVYADYLLPKPSTAQVLLADRYANAVADADVTAAEATAGDELVYSLQVQNAHDCAVLSNVRAWLDAGTTRLELSSDASSWVAPTNEGGALLLGDLPVEHQAYLYVRRTIAAEAAADPDVLNLVHFAFDS